MSDYYITLLEQEQEDRERQALDEYEVLADEREPINNTREDEF